MINRPEPALRTIELMEHMQENNLNNAHYFSGVPHKQQLQHTFIHSMQTLVNEEIVHTDL